MDAAVSVEQLCHLIQQDLQAQSKVLGHCENPVSLQRQEEIYDSASKASIKDVCRALDPDIQEAGIVEGVFLPKIAVIENSGLNS